jgi:hypothetical protein
LNKPQLIAPIALSVALLISLLLFFLIPQPMQQRILFFPDTAGGERHAEWHAIPYRHGRADQVQAVVEELQLGPSGIGAVPFLSRDASIRSVILRDRSSLYIDFDSQIMFDQRYDELNFSVISDLLEQNLTRNFPGLTVLAFLIEGQLPDTPTFGEIGR